MSVVKYYTVIWKEKETDGIITTHIYARNEDEALKAALKEIQLYTDAESIDESDIMIEEFDVSRYVSADSIISNRIGR